MKDTDVAWLAGLFEGEGCIWHTTRQSSGGETLHYYMLKMNMTDEDVVRRAAAITGCLDVYGPRRSKTPTTKPFWTWEVRKRADVTRLLTLMRPYMGQRRGALADKALAWSAAKDAEAEARKGVCKKGHDITAENSTYYHAARNTTVCRECNREWQRAYRKRAKV